MACQTLYLAELCSQENADLYRHIRILYEKYKIRKNSCWKKIQSKFKYIGKLYFSNKNNVFSLIYLLKLIGFQTFSHSHDMCQLNTTIQFRKYFLELAATLHSCSYEDNVLFVQKTGRLEEMCR